MHTGPNLPGITRFGFAQRLTADTGLPAVVDNDATCAAWGEHERGASAGQNHSVLVTLGTGIGAGITVKGEVLRGANGFAGEPGHMIVDPDGPPCPCGRRGCWERYGSGSGLARLGRDAAHAGLLPRVVELAGGDPEDVRGEHVTQAAGGRLRRCDRGAPPVRLVGGAGHREPRRRPRLGDGRHRRRAWWHRETLVLDPIRAAFPELLFGGTVRPEVPIVQATLGEHAGAIGAALLAAQRTG